MARQAKQAKTARTARVAADLIAGKTVNEIAERENVSRGTASAIANSPECLHLIARLVDAEMESVTAIFTKVLTSVDEALQARREYVSEGVVLQGGPDHYARLSAGKLFVALCLAGRPKPKDVAKPDEQRTFQLEEIEKALAGRNVN
jgi:hypothetical protein